MKRVYKYAVQLTDQSEIPLPVGAQVLTVQVQLDQVYIWALVEPAPLEIRKFRLAGTGHDIDEPVRYIGTVQLFGGSFVGHLFEVIDG